MTHDPHEKQLHDRLEHATQAGPPPTTDARDLLQRARARQGRRTRVLGAAAVGLAALAVGAVVVLPSILDDEPGGAPQPDAPAAAAGLSEAQVMEACADQITTAVDFYDGSAGDVPENLRPASGEHQPGDAVGLFAADQRAGTAGAAATPFLVCGIPDDGVTAEQVADPAATETDRVLNRCSAGQPDGSAPLTDAEVVTTAEVEGRSIAAIRSGENWFQCVWGPQPDDTGMFATVPAESDEPVLESVLVGRAGKTRTEGSGGFYWYAGRAPEGTTKVIVLDESGSEQKVKVVDGGFAVLLHRPGPMQAIELIPVEG